MERGGWTTNTTLQNVYQHTFSAERDAVDEKIDEYLKNCLDDTKDDMTYKKRLNIYVFNGFDSHHPLQNKTVGYPAVFTFSCVKEKYF